MPLNMLENNNVVGIWEGEVNALVINIEKKNITKWQLSNNNNLPPPPTRPHIQPLIRTDSRYSHSHIKQPQPNITREIWGQIRGDVVQRVLILGICQISSI